MENNRFSQIGLNIALIAGGLVVLLLGIALIPGGLVIAQQILSFFGMILGWIWVVIKFLLSLALWILMQIGVCFAAPLMIGALARYGATLLDRRFDEDHKINAVVHWIFAPSAGAGIGLAWTALVMWMATWPTWFGGLFRLLGWSGTWETAPIVWGIIALVLFVFGYAINGDSK